MKRFLVLFVVLCASTLALAQKADVAFVAGGSFVSNTNVTVLSAPNVADTLKTNNHLFLEGALGVRLVNARLISLHLDVPFAGIPSQKITLASDPSTVVDHLSTLFITPGLKLKVLPGAPISPWVAAGGGWARFSTDSGFRTNDGVVEYGGGLDFKSGLPILGFRAEIRDFVTGDPNFGISSIASSGNLNGNSSFHHHNLMAGGGIVLRF